MREFKGSPTPWVIDAENYHDYGLIDAKGCEIMIIKAECGLDDYNASLIAAAPDLLEALQCITHALGYGSSMDVAKGEEMARAAITKALGETK